MLFDSIHKHNMYCMCLLIGWIYSMYFMQIWERVYREYVGWWSIDLFSNNG